MPLLILLGQWFIPKLAPSWLTGKTAKSHLSSQSFKAELTLYLCMLNAINKTKYFIWFHHISKSLIKLQLCLDTYYLYAWTATAKATAGDAPFGGEASVMISIKIIQHRELTINS